MTQTLKWDGKLDSAAAADLHADLKALRGQPVVADLTGCAGIGALCAQVLLAAQAAWSRDDTAFAVRADDTVVQDLALLGAQGLLTERGAA